MPDFCTALRQTHGPLSPLSETLHRPPGVRASAFIAPSPDLQPSSLRDLIWSGWSGGHDVPEGLGLRQPRWRWMSGLTVNTSAELCSPIALKSQQRAFWSACPQNCAGLLFFPPIGDIFRQTGLDY